MCSSDLSKTFPANNNLTFGGSYTTNNTGYYQFDFMDIDPSGGYTPGHILAAGFFRVLKKPCSEVCPSITPTPTPIATSTPTPTPPSPTPLSCGSDEHLNLQGDKCLKWELGGPPPPPSTGPGQVLGASTSKGQVLGASTLGATGSASDTIAASMIAVGVVFAVISMYEIKKSN